jgi:hypothetical protein
MVRPGRGAVVLLLGCSWQCVCVCVSPLAVAE